MVAICAVAKKCAMLILFIFWRLPEIIGGKQAQYTEYDIIRQYDRVWRERNTKEVAGRKRGKELGS